MLRSALLAGLAASALATPAIAGSKYTMVSQSVMVLEGIPARAKKPKPVVAAPVVRASVESGEMMTAEQRRLLRYGVAEESRDAAAEAERTIVEEDAASTMEETVEAEPEVEPETKAASVTVSPDASGDGAAKPRVSARSTTANAKVDPEKLVESVKRQETQEAPEIPDRALDQLNSAASG